MIRRFLLQKEWYRKNFNKRTIYFSNNRWKGIYEFRRGEKMEQVEGDIRYLTWCLCGNELVHSKSYTGRTVTEGMTVYKYICTHCDRIQYRNPTLIPGLLECNERGTPIF